MSSSVISRNTMQGLPTAITPTGISLFTTLPAPIMLPFPIVTPPHTVALAPIHTSSSIVIGFEVPIPSALCIGRIACPEQVVQSYSFQI